MEYGGPASTFSVSKKLSNGFAYGFSEKSVYDGVFSTPVNYKPSAIPSSAEDYSEIFGRYGASRSPSIPILNVPELNEKDVSAKIRDSDSKLDYSKVFGGFGNLDAAISYEDIFSQPRREATVSEQQRSPEKRGNPSRGEDSSSCTINHPAVSLGNSNKKDGAKKISVSYNKINQGITNTIHDTTHVAQLHAIPDYACLIDENSSLKVNTANDPSVAYHKDSSVDNLKREKNCSKQITCPPPEIVVQYPCGSKVHEKSDRWASNSNIQWFDEDASDSGTQNMKIRLPDTLACDSDNHISEFKGANSKSEIFKCDASESGTRTSLPHEFDDIVDTNSEAATSVAALRKAIEDAQEKFKLAKESTAKGKEKSQDCKLKLNDDFRRGKRFGCLAGRSERSREIEPQIICKERDPKQIPSEIERPTVNACKVALDIMDSKASSFSANAVTETLTESKATHVESGLEELESKEEDIFYEFAVTDESEEPKLDSETFYESVDVENSDEELVSIVDNMEIKMHTVDQFRQSEEEKYWNPFKMLDEGGKTVEVVDEDLIENKIESDVGSGNGAYNNEEFVHEIKAVQDMQNQEGNEDRFKVTNKLSETDNKVDLSFKQEECERVVIMFLKQTEPKEVSQFQEGNEYSLNISRATEQCDLVVAGESGGNGKVFVQEKKSLENRAYGVRELQEPIDYNTLTELQDWCLLNSDRQTDPEHIEIGEDNCNLDESKNSPEHICPVESTKKVSDVHIQEKVEKTTDHIHANEEFEKRHRENNAWNEHLMLQEDGKVENLLNRVSTEVEEKNREQEETSEQTAAPKNGTITHNVYETMGETVDENQMLREKEKYENLPSGVTSVGEDHNGEPEEICSWVAATRNEKSTHENNIVGNLIVTEDASEHVVDGDEGFHPNKHDEAAKVYVPEYFIDAATIETAEKFTVKADIVGQNEHRCVDVAETICNLVETEAFIPHSGRMSENTSEDDVSVHGDMDESHSAFSPWERLVASNTNVEATGPPSLSEQELKGKECQEIKTVKISVEVKENHQTTMSMGEIEADITNGDLGKVELEKERHRRIEADKEREREREREKGKEKIAVERAIREARERAFADARERAAAGKATAEARRRVISESQERLGKKGNHANEKSLTEKAAMEARLKAERAAVERATAEARTRALERAMSDKAVLEAKNKDLQHNSSWSSNDFRHTKSFNHGASRSSAVLDGYDGESSQRCKARSERHQRVMERAAKALAEKSMRDLLVQKEQEERNRLAELLDADIRRWSSGKAGNLRALLSTLQYILGPNSGWQPIPLTDIVMATAVKKAYRKATLFVHPDKLQQRGASIQQKYICEKVFDLLKEGWNRFNMEER